jgi:flagellar basal body rod protein FlgG
MNDLFQIAGIGMADGRQRLEAIGQNAASTALPGYRRHVVSGSPFAALVAAAPDTRAAAEVAAGAPIHVDLQRGALRSTGRGLDVAIDADDAYFALTDGEHTWLTRAGAFALDDDGVLVGEGGLRVVGAQGDIRLADTDVEVGADGRITRQGETVATLSLLRPSDPRALVAAQGSLLDAPGGTEPAETARVRGGMLEASNTDATREMVDVVSLSRQFEALSRVVQGYDELLGRTIDKLSEA